MSEKLNVFQNKTKIWNKNAILYPTRCSCLLIIVICLFFRLHIYNWWQISEVCMSKLSWESVEGRVRVLTQQKRNCWLYGFAGLLMTCRKPVGTSTLASLWLRSFSFHFFFFFKAISVNFFCAASNFPMSRQEDISHQHHRQVMSRNIVGASWIQSSTGWKGILKAIGLQWTPVGLICSFGSKTTQKRSLYVCYLHLPTSHVFLKPL